MSEKLWGWCPESALKEKDYDLGFCGFSGTAHVVTESYFCVISFRMSDVPESLRMDVAYRVYLRFVRDSEAHVPPDIAKRLFPVAATGVKEAADLLMDGIEQINRYFSSVMKMNEYHDDIRYLIEVSIGVLDYFIGCLCHFRSELGDVADSRINELKFKRSYMLSLRMHI